MQFLLVSVLPAVLIVSAVTDILKFQIPNILPIVLFLAFPLIVLYTNSGPDFFLDGLYLGAIAIIAGFALFALNVLGGGDAKLIAAALPWFGMDGFFPFLLYTGIIGGQLAIAILLLRTMPPLPIGPRLTFLSGLQESKKGIPYAVAIAIAGIIVFPETDLFVKALGL